MKRSTLTFFLMPALCGLMAVQAQEKTFTISTDAPYEVYVSGSSTLHDWKATVGKVTDFPATLKINLAQGGAIEHFGFKAEGKSMDGGRGSTMNDKIYKAVKCDVHPYITFTQTKPAQIQPGAGGEIKLVSSGTISIGGVEKAVDVEVKGTLKDGKLTFMGAKDLKLSDFNIDPPTAMFGQIETKDDITVHFTFNYQLQ